MQNGIIIEVGQLNVRKINLNTFFQSSQNSFPSISIYPHFAESGM